jgi:hypothetical protein
MIETQQYSHDTRLKVLHKQLDLIDEKSIAECGSENLV